MTDHLAPVVLTERTTEWQATMLANALEAQGIVAKTTGGLTAGFRAEAPGMVQVLVRTQDLQRAKKFLEAWDQQ